MKSLDFWGHFEEVALEGVSKSTQAYGTQTRQREEPDQRNTCMSTGSKTVTNTREESDQDIGDKEYCAIPMHISCGTKTLTEQREEPEQDESCRKHVAIPLQFPRWETFTRTREEPDQEESSHKYVAIPMNIRAQT